MNSRERLKTILKFRIPDRIGMVDSAYWPPTLERWRKEGLPEKVSPAEYFDMDRVSAVTFDATLRLPVERIEETAEYEIVKDANGVTTKKWKGHYATPLQLDFTVKRFEDWKAHKDRLIPTADRISSDMKQKFDNARKAGCHITYRPPEPCWYALRLLGHDNALMLMLDQPEFIEDIISTVTEFAMGLCSAAMRKGMMADGIWMFSDLCYKNGMLFSPATYRNLLMPYHKKLAAFCRSHKMPMLLHCDGDVREFIPLLIEAGFTAVQPLEARCGNDVRELKRRYGAQIVFFGNISTDAMSRGRLSIEEEVVSKILVAKEGGGYIYHCDHSVPPTVSFENYAYVIELLKKHGRY